IHRRSLEVSLLNAQVEDIQTQRHIEKLGQKFALIVSLAGIAAGVIMGVTGHPVAGSVLSGGTILSLAALFIYGRERKLEEERKSQSHKATSANISKPPQDPLPTTDIARQTNI